MPALALTFDDGPDPVWTGALLDVLDEFGAQATFFPMAHRAATQPELLARIVAAGHTVGLHCAEHWRHSHRGAKWVADDTAEALDLLSRVDIHPTLWRTPWGDVAPWTAGIARDHGLEVVRWTTDTHDWRGDSAATMFAATRTGLGPGAVVLAHDGIGPGAHHHDIRETVSYVRLVAHHAEAAGLDLAAMDRGTVSTGAAA